MSIIGQKVLPIKQPMLCSILSLLPMLYYAILCYAMLGISHNKLGNWVSTIINSNSCVCIASQPRPDFSYRCVPSCYMLHKIASDSLFTAGNWELSSSDPNSKTIKQN